MSREPGPIQTATHLHFFIYLMSFVVAAVMLFLKETTKMGREKMGVVFHSTTQKR